MPERRKTKEELAAELQTSAESESDSDSPADPERGPPEGDFEAISDQDQKETNELFHILHNEGYMTAGTYEVTSDGENTLVSLQVMLPSSGGLPTDVSNGDSEGDA